jgi:hypothetical protein
VVKPLGATRHGEAFDTLPQLAEAYFDRHLVQVEPSQSYVLGMVQSGQRTLLETVDQIAITQSLPIARSIHRLSSKSKSDQRMFHWSLSAPLQRFGSAS